MKPVKGEIRHLIKQADALMSGYCKLLKMAGILVRMIHKAMNADGCFILFSDKTGPSIVAYHKFLNTTYWEVHINGTQTNIEYESDNQRI